MTIAYVNSVIAQGTVNSTGDSAATNMSGANFLAGLKNGLSGYTVSDSLGNTWDQTTVTQEPNVFGNLTKLVFVPNATVGSSQTFKCDSTSGAPAFAVGGYSNVLTASPFDGNSNYDSSTGSYGSTCVVGSVTPGQDSSLVVGGCTLIWDGTLSVDVGTIRISNHYSSGNYYGTSLWDQIQTTATTVAPTFSWNGGDNFAASVIASFKPAAGGGDTLWAQSCC
jgi:hypothetical protein